MERYEGGERWGDGGYDDADAPTPGDDPNLGDAWSGDPSLNVSLPPVESPTPAPAIPAPVSSGFDFSKAIANVSQAALSVLQVQAAYRASRQPAIRTVSLSPSGNSKTANSDGTVTVRDANGATIGRERPEVGVPYALPDGSLIVNNGNGTFDTISPGGVRRTRSYGVSSSLVSSDGFGSAAGYVLGALALVGFAFWASKRRG